LEAVTKKPAASPELFQELARSAYSVLPRTLVWGWMAFLLLLVSILSIMNWNETYWDFGDGNYLYVGQRILDGLVPYRDILAPQPPLHQVGAALCQWFGEGVFGSALVGARFYTLVQRLLCLVLIFFVAREWFRSDAHGLVAATIYAFLPIGFWWSIGVQSENLELVFLLIGFWGVLRLEKNSLLLGGIGSALAMHCNMTAVPYFLSNVVFLAARRPRLLGWYLATAVPIWGVIAGVTWFWAGPDYLDNVIFNQVGSFPREELSGQSLLSYAWGKITSQGYEVWILEGQFILLGLAALAFRWGQSLYFLERKSDDFRRFEYAAWYCIGMLLSICFTAKGGTVNYIFVLGEPAVALLAADGIVRGLGVVLKGWSPSLKAASALVVSVVLICANPNAFRNIQYTVEGIQAELPYSERIGLGNPPRMLNTVEEARELIEATTQPGDPILAPPFYAWLTHRKVAGEFAENYLWTIKYQNERYDLSQGIISEPGPAILKVQELAEQIRNREIPLLFMDDKLTGQIAPLRNALVGNYERYAPFPTFHSRHNIIEVYVPIPPAALASRTTQE
jgi:hypothetical protein